MAITRIQNNQITDSSAGNIYLGVNAAAKVQDYSVTAGKLQNNLTYGSDLTITGNLTVQGNTTTIDTVNLTVEDPLILLAKEQTGSPTLDIGYIGKRGTSDNIALVWKEDQDEFVAAFTTSENTCPSMAQATLMATWPWPTYSLIRAPTSTSATIAYKTWLNLRPIAMQLPNSMLTAWLARALRLKMTQPTLPQYLVVIH